MFCVQPTTIVLEETRSTMPLPVLIQGIPWKARPPSRSAAALWVLLLFLVPAVLATMERTRCSMQQPPSVDGSATLVPQQSTVSLAWFWLALQVPIALNLHRPRHHALLARMRQALELPAWQNVSPVTMATTPLPPAPPSVSPVQATATPLLQARPLHRNVCARLDTLVLSATSMPVSK